MAGMRSDALHADLLRECLVRLDEFTTQELAIATGSTAIGSKWGLGYPHTSDINNTMGLIVIQWDFIVIQWNINITYTIRL